MRLPMIPNYVIDHLVAEGGTARVYWGIDLRSGYAVAIKELKARFFRNKSVRDSFKAIETQLYLNLQHPNIPRLVDFVELPHRDELYLIIEFIDGKTLEQHIHYDVGLLPEEKALPIFYEILETVAYIHNSGYLHLDIKPNNVMMMPNGKIKIIDLGIASRLSDAESGVTGYGTPAYMPPEQSEGVSCGKYTDIFALGVLLFEMLTGRPPFQLESFTRDGLREIRRKIKEDPTPVMKEYYPFMSEELQGVVNKAMEKEPANRYQSCEELMHDIRTIMKKRKIKFL